MGALSTIAKKMGKMLRTGVKRTPKKIYADKGPVDMLPKAKGKISKAKAKLAKRKNEMKHMDKDDSPSYKKVVSAGVEKQEERTEMLKRSKKPGMSKEYKMRKQWKLRLDNMKRQMMKQGHSKELAQEIGELQKKIDGSYKEKD